MSVLPSSIFPPFAITLVVALFSLITQEHCSLTFLQAKGIKPGCLPFTWTWTTSLDCERSIKNSPASSWYCIAFGKVNL